MSFLDRLNAIVTAKGLEPKDVVSRTGVPYDQLTRLGGPRGPSANKLRDIVLGLQVDADYLLESDERYDDMTPIQAAANMALEKYSIKCARADEPISESEMLEMRRVANVSTKPPIWVEDWETHHERMLLAAEARALSSAPVTTEARGVARRHRQRRPMQS